MLRELEGKYLTWSDNASFESHDLLNKHPSGKCETTFFVLFVEQDLKPPKTIQALNNPLIAHKN